MREKLDELARLHGEAQKTTWQAGAAREIYAAFPAILEHLRELEGERDLMHAALSDIYYRSIPLGEDSGHSTISHIAADAMRGKNSNPLAARDAQQRREGAVMKLLDMSLGGFAWDETGLLREAESMLLDAGQRERYETLLAEAQRLREGK
jgi:hypothetical protein